MIRAVAAIGPRRPTPSRRRYAHSVLLVPGVFMGERTEGGRVYLLADASTCVLVDTGAPDGTLGVGQLIEAAGRQPHEVRLILLTHPHRGHAGNAAGLRLLTGAPVAASAAAVAALADPPPPPRRLLRRDEPMEQVRVDRRLEAGERIDIAGGIEVIDAPGHADGSLAFHLLGPDVLCTGDAASVGRRGLGPPPRRRCGDPDRARETHARLEGVGARVIAPGHGYPLVDGRPPTVRRG